MQTFRQPGEQTYVRLGDRRGVSDRARIAGNLTWASTETECHPGTRAYPSPPMSGGSPTFPPKPVQEAGTQVQSSFQAASHNVYHSLPTAHGSDSGAGYGHPTSTSAQPHPPLAPSAGIRPYPLDPAERLAYPGGRPEERFGPSQSLPAMSASQQPQYPLPSVSGAMPMASPYSLPPRPPTSEGASYASPKSQRKTKGHVASACVPCKRAHLRCDAQRPCSRCLSNGKEDACVDVQHKKRGRPRLRDDREMRFDASRFQHDPVLKRPVSLYAPVSAPAVPFDDPLRRSQSYRVLKSQPTEPITPRYLDRGSATDANIFPAPPMMQLRPPEPLAFVTVDFEIARVSNVFVEAIGAGQAQSILGRKLEDIIAPQERDRVAALQRALQEEQGRKEPNYLPPIFGRQDMDRIVHSLPQDAEFVSRLPLDRHDVFTFLTSQRQGRQFPIRIGLVKEDSIYFVVLVLVIHPRPYPPPPPSPFAREIPYSYQPQPYLPQRTPVSASFETNQHRLGDQREPRAGPQALQQSASTAHTRAVPSPGVSPNIPAYAATSGRFEHPAGPSYQIPRSELAPARAPVQPGYQLPPIRSQNQPGPAIDPRSSRVDIGGLIDRPDPAHHGQ